MARSPDGQTASNPPSASLSDLVIDAAVRAATSQLPGGGMPARLMGAAMYGFGTEIFRQLTDDEHADRLKRAFAELLVPANAADFVAGYTAGAVAGLVSPVTDLLGLGALGEQMPMIAANLARNAWVKSAELAAEAHAIGAAFDALKLQAKARFATLRKDPAAVFALLDELEAQATNAASRAGGDAAKKTVAYFSGKDEEPQEGGASAPQESVTDALLNSKPGELSGVLSFVTAKGTQLRKAIFKTPWQKIGYNIGYAVGAIVVNVLLLAATDGIGNLIVEVSAGMGKLAPLLAGVEKALVGLGTRIAEAERAIAAALSALLKPLSGATKWLEPLLKPLGELLERLGGFVRKLLGLPEKAATSAGARVGASLANEATEKFGPKAAPKAPSKLPLPEPKPLPPVKAPETPGGPYRTPGERPHQPDYPYFPEPSPKPKPQVPPPTPSKPKVPPVKTPETPGGPYRTPGERPIQPDQPSFPEPSPPQKATPKTTSEATPIERGRQYPKSAQTKANEAATAATGKETTSAAAAERPNVSNLDAARQRKLAQTRAKPVARQGKRAVGAENQPVAVYTDEEIGESIAEQTATPGHSEPFNPGDVPDANVRKTRTVRTTEYDPQVGDSGLLGDRLAKADLPKPGPNYEAHHIVPADEPRAAALREFLEQRGFRDINDVDNGVWLPRGSRAQNIGGEFKHEFTFDNPHFNDEYFTRLEDILMKDPKIRPAGIRFKLRQIRMFLKQGKLPPPML